VEKQQEQNTSDESQRLHSPPHADNNSADATLIQEERHLQAVKGSNRRLEFQLRAWFVRWHGFVLVFSTARAMEHGLSPFGRANYENLLPAVPTIHHVIDRARIFHSHGARHGASVSG
jgi:hypothetical protein